MQRYNGRQSEHSTSAIGLLGSGCDQQLLAGYCRSTALLSTPAETRQLSSGSWSGSASETGSELATLGGAAANRGQFRCRNWSVAEVEVSRWLAFCIISRPSSRGGFSCIGTVATNQSRSLETVGRAGTPVGTCRPALRTTHHGQPTVRGQPCTTGSTAAIVGRTNTGPQWWQWMAAQSSTGTSLACRVAMSFNACR